MNGIRHVLAVCAVATLTSMAAGDEVQTQDVLRVALDLSDGSRIIGIPAFSSIPFQSSDVKTDIRLEQVLQITIGATRETTVLETTSGDVLTGVLNMGSVELTTLFGKVSAGVEHIGDIQVRANTRFGLPAKLKKALVLYYSFDKNEDGRVTDRSGKENTGEVRGALWVEQGRRGGVMQFDGVDDRIAVPDDDSLDMTNLTLAAWICPTDISTGPHRRGWTILEKRPDDACWELMHLDSGRLLVKGASARAEPSGRGAIETGKWTHVAATLSATQGVIYVNGDTFHVSPVTPVKATRGKVQIGMGHYRHPSDDEFTGFMDDIMIFNRALSADEVNTLYNSK